MDGRRLLRALAFGGLVLLLAGGGMGFAVAAAEDGTSALTVPAPRPGDRAVYRVHQDLLGDHVGDRNSVPLDEVVYEWLPETTILDSTFTPHPVQPLQATYVFGKGQEWESQGIVLTGYDPATGLPIQQAGESRGTQPQYFLPGTLGPVGQGIFASNAPPIETTYWGESFGWAVRHPCGQRFPASSEEPTLGRCGWAGSAHPTFAAKGWDELPGGRGFAYQAKDDARLQVWYQSGSPFPVRVVTPMGEAIGDAWSVGRLFTLERVAWASGEGDYEARGPVLPGAPVERVPLVGDWMFDDSSLDEELTLERAYAEAYAAARTSAKTGTAGLTGQYQPQPTVQEWLGEHPDGYLAMADHFLGWGYSQQYPGWALLWVDGPSWVGKVVTYETSVGYESNIFMPEQAPKRIVVNDWWIGRDNGAWIATFPPRHQLPAELPKGSAVADQFHASVSEESLSYYGFRFYCDEACLAGAPAQSSVYVAHTSSSFSTTTSATGGFSTTEGLSIGGDGAAVFRTRYTREAAPVLGLGAPSEEETPHAEATADSGVWRLPSAPATAAGISLLALLASALYYFWPAVKGGALALFSRIEPDRVLEHPSRKTLFALVEANPGIHFQDLARRSGFGRGQLEHHLRKLEGADLVSRVAGGSYTCFFARGQHDRRVMAAAPLLRSDGGRNVLEALQATPGATSRQIALRLGLSAGTVSYHVKRLKDAGLLESAGGSLHLTETGRKAGAIAA